MSTQSRAAQESGVSDLAFDLLTMLQNKLQAIEAYTIYRRDAKAAGHHHVAEFIDRCAAEDRRAVDELRAMVAHQLVVGLENQHGFPEPPGATRPQPDPPPPAERNVVTEASKESFPASDPPAFNVGPRHITRSSS